MNTKKSSLSTEMWPIDKPIPHPLRAREHPDDQLKDLAASLEEFGCIRPILVDENGVVLVGHGVLLAAQRLHWSEVPVIVISHLTDTQKKAYLVVDNQLALNSSWNEEKLRVLLQKIAAENYELNNLGFSPQELDRLLNDLGAERPLRDEDSVPETPALSLIEPGQLWGLGPHYVLCDDATSEKALPRVLKGKTADMVFSDPPYRTKYRQERGEKGFREIVNDNLDEVAFERFLRTACERLLPLTKGAIYLCMSSAELHTLYSAFIAAGGHWSTFIIWDKGHFTLGRSDYQRQYEPILYGWRNGQEHFWCQARNESDVWFVPKPKANALHPTMKPVSLIERAIRNSSRRGDVVLDPFGGSGSTLIACEKTARCARLVEVAPQYVEVIIRRWEAYTGRQARREGDGRTLAELRQERVEVGV